MASSMKAGPETAPDGRLVLDRLRELPGGAQLIELAAARGDVELIGGAVRDVLLDPRATPRELDVVVAEGAAGFAHELAAALHAHARDSQAEHFEATLHERFHTARVTWPGGQIDVATRRSERYPAPGALPDVGPGSRESDRERRDFTVNTLAVALAGPEAGRLDGALGALEDLRERRLRVLHEVSFRDDPTRLLRLARYSARLGFRPDERTAALATEAVDGGALDTVSPARIGAELRLALREPDPLAALASLQRLGVLPALHEAIFFDGDLVEAALGTAASHADGETSPEVLLLSCLLLPGHAYDTSDYETRLRALLDSWELPAAERERTVHSATLARRLVERLSNAPRRPSQIYDVLHAAPLEAVVLATALGGVEGPTKAAAAGERWLDELRHVQLQIGGQDLLAAGIAPGPEIGRRLRRTLLRKLDGELLGSEEELASALEDR
jgi:tRNA nucleotidyltransferase (CCA-adding enzyme)